MKKFIIPIAGLILSTALLAIIFVTDSKPITIEAKAASFCLHADGDYLENHTHIYNYNAACVMYAGCEGNGTFVGYEQYAIPCYGQNAWEEINCYSNSIPQYCCYIITP